MYTTRHAPNPNLGGAQCLSNGHRVFRRNIRGYRTTPKFGRVRVRVLLKVIKIVLEHSVLGSFFSLCVEL
jgi:hypothetical protein